jgi:hypothetical protein
MSFNFKDAKLTYFNQDLQLTSNFIGVFQTEVGGTAFGTVGAASTVTNTFKLNGLRVPSGTGAAGTAAGAANQINPGDSVFCSPATSALTSGLAMYCFISAANTLSISLVNGSAGGIAAGSPNFVVTIMKFGQLDGLSS